MQPRKKLRLAPIGAPDGFEKSLAQSKTKIAVPQFTSAFTSSTTTPKPPPKITAFHSSLDPQLKGASSGEHAKVSFHNVSIPPPRLAIRPDATGTFNRPNPFVAFKDLSHDRNLTSLQQHLPPVHGVDEPHAVPDIALKRLQAPQLLADLLKENEEESTLKLLKSIGIPPRLPVSSDARYLQTISTTSIARVTDIGTDSGNAELASILLYDQHPEIVDGEGGEARRGLNFSPRKKRYGNSDPQFVRGGLASRASQLLTRTHTSLALWQKEAERHALPNPDLRMTIVNIEHMPVPFSKKSSSSCFGIALCRIHPQWFGQTENSTFTSSHRKLFKVVFSFPIPVPQGPSRNLSYFAANAEVYAWRPWHEVKLSPSPPPAAAGVDAGKGAPMPASFPMPLTLGCSPENKTGNDLPLSDTVLLCNRFVFMCQNAAGA
ncbi:hypothetical protein APHAL10511_005447 [Amanita phalloides]|nr:hypothetical protein APHAL10511_005447 [Amanita phalloides]